MMSMSARSRKRSSVNVSAPSQVRGRSGAKSFDYGLDYTMIDLRRRPDLYRVGRGEQGVLLVRPYKQEILPHWRFRTPQVATASAAAILKLFSSYKKRGDFVGMDMARKFLQMGYTRARRYANHASGRKFDADGVPLPFDPDPVKAESAAIFRTAWHQVEADADYTRMRTDHRQRYG
jgi:hypothetical protein